MDKKLEELIDDFGNTQYDCGETTFSGHGYRKLVGIGEEAKKRLIEYIEGEKKCTNQKN